LPATATLKGEVSREMDAGDLEKQRQMFKWALLKGHEEEIASGKDLKNDEPEVKEKLLIEEESEGLEKPNMKK
jgi:hypothetical protein